MTFAELLWITFLAALATDLATGLGALPFFFVKNISPRLQATFTAAAAGMMTAASLSQLVGEGLVRAPGWGVVQVSAGLLTGTFFFRAAKNWLHRHENFDILGLRESGGTSALLIVAAMTLHSLPEGIAIGVSFGAGGTDGSLAFGWSVAAALALHNIPEGVAITVALMGRGVSPLVCMGWAILSSVPQPLGAVPAASAVWIFEPALPAGLGFAAGAMMFLVVEDLLPEATKRCGSSLAATAFGIGLVIMILLGRVVGIA